jgi:hypothetical protein
MQLFITPSAAIYSALIPATKGLLANKYSGATSLRFWINGKNTASGWKTYNPSEAPIYPNATWYLNDLANGGCLTVYLSTIFSTATYAGGDCSLNYHSFCQFT